MRAARNMALVGLLALFVPLWTFASAVVSHDSPGAVLKVNVSLDNDGRVMYSVTRQGHTVIEPSQLGFLLTDAPKLDRNFSVSEAAKRHIAVNQMAGDLPENYERHLQAFQFIKDVPTDWADTRVVNGEIGDFVACARKDRNSDDWYLGSVSDEQARTLEVQLDFRDAGRSYRAQIYRDGDDADWKTRPHSFVTETRSVRQGDSLTLRLAAGGGQAIRFVAARR